MSRFVWFSRLSIGLILISCFLGTVLTVTVDPIIVKGSHFFYKTNGSEFFIRGVCYQDNGHFVFESDSFIDPLGDGPTCARDIPYLLDLRVNVVRAYAVDPTQDHSECMEELAAAGIYVLAGLGGSKNENIIGSSPAWDYGLYQRYQSVVDAFQNYTNVLGFFAGNEVANTTETTAAMAFVKAAVRDTKAYIRQKGYRDIPVGYATNDNAEIRDQLADYLNCGDANDTADFQGLNLYSWCGNSNLEASGYADEIADYQNYSVPVFLSEYGCTAVSPRNFSEVQAIYGSPMTGVFSGGIVYQYYADDANYGLVTALENQVSLSPDFTALSSQIARISPSSTNIAQYTVTNTVEQVCPTVGASWSAAPTLPPTPYQRLCTCMMQSLECIWNGNATDQTISNGITQICSADDVACYGVYTNSTNGTYGAFSACNETEVGSWALNQWYLQQAGNEAACSSLGGIIQSPTTGAAQATDCSIMLQQAGSLGTGTITSTPSPPATAASTSSGAASTGPGTGATSPGGHSKLSGGAIAGIVIALVAGIGGVAAALLWRRRRAQAAGKAAPPDPVLKPELPDNQVRAAGEAKPLIDGRETPAELRASVSPYELQSINYFQPAELEAPHGASEVMYSDDESRRTG